VDEERACVCTFVRRYANRYCKQMLARFFTRALLGYVIGCACEWSAACLSALQLFCLPRALLGRVRMRESE
jgi:hypothetical protein